MKKLFEIQQKLKAPKNLYNSFGGYAYRSAESILEALKPLLAETQTTLLINDELCNIGERYYIMAIVRLYDLELNKMIAETRAYAREEENKKGMDGSQITGASSSYARKYALNGMFMIDDVKDSDTTNTFGKEAETEKTSAYKCKNCGKSISEGAYKNWNGLCADCYKESKKEGK